MNTLSRTIIRTDLFRQASHIDLVSEHGMPDADRPSLKAARSFHEELGLLVEPNPRSMMHALGDTYDGIGWDTFLSILSAYGFEARQDAEALAGFPLWMERESDVVLYHPEKCLLLRATPSRFRRDRVVVNTASVFARVKEKEGLSGREHLLHCSTNPKREDGTTFISMDARSGVINHIEHVGEGNTFEPILYTATP